MAAVVARSGTALRATSEARLVADIRLALGREPDLVLWRNAAGRATYGGGRTARFGLVKGASDLIGILRVEVMDAETGDIAETVGRFVALEVKTPTGALRPDQRLFLALVERMGGFAAVVRSVDEARAAIARARAWDTE